MAPALFVIGNSRSGTSWVFDLCASHPDLSMGFESKLPVEGIEVFRRSAGHLRGADPRSAMVDLFTALRTEIDDPMNSELSLRLGDPSVVDRAVASYRADPGWPAVCAAIFCSLEDTTHWGNKMLRIELEPLLRQQWPDAKFLIMTRDPRGVVASQGKKFGHSIGYSTMYWNTHAEFIRDRLGLRPGEHDEHHIVVDVLEMARNPRPTLEWIFSAVGLDTAPIGELLDRYPADPDGLGKWRGALDPSRQRRIEEYCFEQMRSLGYEPELATRQRQLGRTRKILELAREHGVEVVRHPSAVRRKQVVERLKAALELDR